MSDPDQPANPAPDASELQSALFAQLVMQQANMALMLLGRTPHPETGKTVRDLDAAQLFIGQLEMLEAKTKGNLSRDEERLLRQSLMSLRMAFVEAVKQPIAEENKPAPQPESPRASSQATPAESGDAAAGETAKRFSKTYPT